MTKEAMYQSMGISPEVLRFGERIEASLEARFRKIDERMEYNQLKVVGAMQKARVEAAEGAPCHAGEACGDGTYGREHRVRL